MKRIVKNKKRGSRKKNKKLRLQELEKKVAPSSAGKKPPIPPPYAPGTYYGLAKRSNLR